MNLGRQPIPPIPPISPISPIFDFQFSTFIYNFAKRKKLNIGFENRVFNLLGKISFEIFLFHPIAIVLGIKLVTTFQIPLCSVYLFGFCFTVLFAWIMNRLCGFLYSE